MAESNNQPLWILSMVAIVGIVAIVISLTATQRSSGVQYMPTPRVQTTTPSATQIAAAEAQAEAQFKQQTAAKNIGGQAMDSGGSGKCKLLSIQGETGFLCQSYDADGNWDPNSEQVWVPTNWNMY